MKYSNALSSLKNVLKSQGKLIPSSYVLNNLKINKPYSTVFPVDNRLHVNFQKNIVQKSPFPLPKQNFTTSIKTSVIEIDGVRFALEKSGVTFNDIGGFDDAKRECQDIIDFLKNPSSFDKSNIQIPRGIIIKGNEDIGKSKIASAIAAESNVLSMTVHAGQLISLGVAGQEKLFRHLEQFASPSCVLIVKNIHLFTELQNENINEINAIQNFLSFVDNSSNIVIIGTSDSNNFAGPLMKTGRFEHILLRMPTESERYEILEIKTRDRRLDESVNLAKLASITAGFTPAKIESWVSKAARISRSKNEASITIESFIDAFISIQRGSIGASHISLEKKRSVAIHEAGHALLAHKLGFELIFVSILKVNDEGVNCLHLYDEYQQTKHNLFSWIGILLAGRAAEIVKDNIQLGSESDLNTVKSYLQHMILNEGMGTCILGSNYYEDSSQLANLLLEHAVKIIKENEHELDNLTNALIENEIVYGHDIAKICQGEKINRNHFHSNTNKKSSLVTNGLFNVNTASESSKIVTINLPNNIGTLNSEQVANALKIKLDYIDALQLDFYGNLLIHFTHDYDDHEHFENENSIEADFLKNDVVMVYIREWSKGSPPYVCIQQESIEKFYKIVNESNSQPEIIMTGC